MKRNKNSYHFKKVSVTILEEEELPLFYPLLPEELKRMCLTQDIIVLGAVGTDSRNARHACGIMVIRVISKDIMLLRWIMVAPANQRQGIGCQLMAAAQTIAGEMNMKMAGNFSEKAETNIRGSIYSFLQKNGFVISGEEAKSYVTTLGEIGCEPFFQRTVKDRRTTTLEEVSSAMLMRFNYHLREEGQLFIGPVSKEKVLSDISTVIVKEGEIKACIIFREIKEKKLELAFVYTDRKKTAQMPLLLIQAYHMMKGKYSEDTVIVLPCVTRVSGRLVEAMVPSAKVEQIAYHVQWSHEKI